MNGWQRETNWRREEEMKNEKLVEALEQISHEPQNSMGDSAGIAREALKKYGVKNEKL